MNLKGNHLKWPGYWLLCLGLLGAGWIFAAPTSQATAGALRQGADDGPAIFQRYCAACHTIGGGDLIGPDLQGVMERRERAWVEAFIARPDQVLASGDPLAQELLDQYKLAMPNLGLNETQVAALLTYLEAPDGAGDPTSGTASDTTAAVVSGGQPEAGRALFTGEQKLQNGGTPCIACHSTAGVSAVGGGVLGPDLTQVYTRLGDIGLSSSLQSLPFPTMQGIFMNRPLSAQEQADLLAYFQQTAQQPVQVSALEDYKVWGLGAAGALVLFGLMLIFWPRQRESISARLRRSA